MSEKTTNSKRPTHAIWSILGETAEKKGRWHRVGSAWMNKDRKGLRLTFDSIPLSGQVLVREITEQDEAANGDGASQGGAQ